MGSRVKICVHHHGTTDIIEDVDTSKLCMLHLLKYSEKFKYSKYDFLYFQTDGHNFEKGVRLLYDQNTLDDMLKVCKPYNLINIYVDHKKRFQCECTDELPNRDKILKFNIKDYDLEEDEMGGADHYLDEEEIGGGDFDLEGGKVMHCSLCKKPGHKKTTCATRHDQQRNAQQGNDAQAENTYDQNTTVNKQSGTCRPKLPVRRPAAPGVVIKDPIPTPKTTPDLNDVLKKNKGKVSETSCTKRKDRPYWMTNCLRKKKP
ncbi:hypothetical protein ACET3Z_026530 [Daucus carota]